jgi:hypothetical protein
MKKFLIALNIVIWSIVCFEVAHAAETAPTIKKVCHKDAKTGKDKCKDVKVHKKHEGTVVPEKKKK